VSATTFGPDRASIEVLVFREGLLSAAGHDLLLRAAAFEIAVERGVPSVTVRVDPASLRVVAALRDGRPLPGALSPHDAGEIEATIASTVLRVRRFPELRFASSDVSLEGDGHRIRGTLTLAGVTRDLVVQARRESDRLVAEVPLQQPDFGIRPYTAMLGALRVKPGVVVRASLPAAGP
jgi:polyisoprenoid-binding protein YceI